MGRGSSKASKSRGSSGATSTANTGEARLSTLQAGKRARRKMSPATEALLTQFAGTGAMDLKRSRDGSYTANFRASTSTSSRTKWEKKLRTAGFRQQSLVTWVRKKPEWEL